MFILKKLFLAVKLYFVHFRKYLSLC